MAEIVLVTGVPGTGKTAKVVSMMVNDPMFQPDENGISRKVFTNINGLKLPHIRVESDGEQYPVSTPETLSFHDIHEWIKKPENHGSIVIIDEVQDVWPARSAGSKVPKNVSWLNTHRHLGVDIFVLTQNPKNIDINLRGLVKKHWHVAMNKLGMRTLLEWKYCADNPISQAKDAFASIYKVDDKIFDLYKSAEIHTENKIKRTKWVYVLPVVILLVPIFVGLSYYMLKSRYGTPSEELQTAEQSASDTISDTTNSNSLATAKGQSLTADLYIPTLAEKPESKPLYDGVRHIRTFEMLSACIEGGKTGCTCYSQQGTPLKEITKELCQDYVKNGLPFNPYQDEQSIQTDSKVSDTPETSNSSIISLTGENKFTL
ncbi:zonular occludens toxin family protein [Neisseria weaveri]|uniref:zonular occludens toxin family protein n=1 Tax=Neisseria weaveri TaxID=28091 RepID=UPI0007C9B366|nr:zonular occludens toxin domain-containing protein [Neisseria weaveri]SAY50693.1 phage associated protein [Neisseria weaveri]